MQIGLSTRLLNKRDLQGIVKDAWIESFSVSFRSLYARGPKWSISIPLTCARISSRSGWLTCVLYVAYKKYRYLIRARSSVFVSFLLMSSEWLVRATRHSQRLIGSQRLSEDVFWCIPRILSMISWSNIHVWKVRRCVQVSGWIP